MQRDLLKELQDWLNGNPEENEVIVIRAPGHVHVKLQYGNITTVHKEGATIHDALGAALDRAKELPNKQRRKEQLSLDVMIPGLD